MGEKNLTKTTSESSGKKIGRPKGAKNKLKKADQIALTNQFLRVSRQRFDKVLQALFEQAEAGDLKAIRIILDKVVPQATLEEEGHNSGQAPIVLNITGIDNVKVNNDPVKSPSEALMENSIEADYEEIENEG